MAIRPVMISDSMLDILGEMPRCGDHSANLGMVHPRTSSSASRKEQDRIEQAKK